MSEGCLELIRLEIPVSLGPGAGEIRHLDARLNTPVQRVIAARVLAALQSSHAQTADGRHVDSAAAAVRWILERIAERIDPQP